MMIKEVHNNPIVIQDSTILIKDTVLISTDQDSLKNITDSIDLPGAGDISSILDSIDTASSQSTVAGESLTGDSASVRARILQSHEYPLRSEQSQTIVGEIPYLFENDANIFTDNNHLMKFGDQYYFIRDSAGLVYKQEPSQVETNILQKDREDNLSGQTPLFDMSPDWLMGIVIASLIVLAWLKLFFHKFINQTITTLWNFQFSQKEFRDHNVFSRRIAFILNLNFIIIGGLFVYLVFNYFRINPFQLKPFLLYLFCASLVTIILLIKQILLVLTGFIFNQQENFMEYLHQILLIYKNIGVFFIPLVIAIAYIQANLRIYLIIIGLVLFILGYLFHFVKGIQIIIKKDVLLFYLILYLCTLEILPVVLYCKFFSSWL